MVNQIIQMAFVPTVAVVLSLMLFFKNKTLDKKIRFFYIAAVIILAVLIVTDITDYYLSTLEKLNNFRYFTSVVGYSLRPIALLLMLFTLIRYQNSRKKTWILVIPAIINILIFAFGSFGGITFVFKENNEFVRGPLGITPFIVSAIYMIIIVYLICSHVRYIEFTELVLVLTMLFFTLAAVVVESVLDVRCLVNGIGIISADCYFLYLNTQVYRRDKLTNLLNRSSFDIDVKNHTGKAFIICVDMDNLKLINDTNGHFIGDQALMCIAAALRENFDIHSKVYRIGGDEFVIISRLEEERIIRRFKHVNDILAEQHYSVSYGYELWNGYDDFEETYKKADAKMYKFKEEMKKKMTSKK